jgi:transposase-like protein
MASGSCSVERRAMAFEPMHCSTCHGVAVVKYGKTSADKQRFRCQNPACKGVTFIHNYTYQGSLPEGKRTIVDMSLNGSGIRDIARVLHVSPSTVIHELKKSA